MYRGLVFAVLVGAALVGSGLLGPLAAGSGPESPGSSRGVDFELAYGAARAVQGFPRIDGGGPLATDNPDARAMYIVVGESPPLAAYRGGIPGLAPVEPAASGAPRFDADSAASRAYLRHISEEQAQLLARIESALDRGVDVRFRYQAALNGFALALTPSEAERVASIPGVEVIVRDFARRLLTDNGPGWIGAPAIWVGGATGGGTKGEGIVVGVIDTGINADHPSFADPGPFDNYQYPPYGLLSGGPGYKGICDPVTGLPVCNDKLVGVYDFTPVGTGADEVGHGSHTASTAAGNELDAVLVAPTMTLERHISGVAPHANIIAYKACVGLTAPAGECLLTALLAAINQATLDEVDVINFSIGGGPSDPWTDLDSLAFLEARRAGVFVSASAGNDGPGPGTVGSPANSPWVLTVGASTHDRKLTNGLINMAGGGSPPPADINGKGLTSAYGSATIVYAGAYGFPLCGDGLANPTTGEAEINPFPPGTFNGEIVVCDRGTYGRVEKGQNVKEGGAGGMVLANDAANGDSLVGDPHALPAVHISFSNGQILKTWLASGTGHTGAIRGFIPDINAAHGDVMASFSSRGPNAAGDIIKPDVTAPGVDILAAFHDAAGPAPQYGVISGTSMSSPHAAGAAALLRAVHPEWTPDQVRSALMTTAFTTLPGTGSEVHEVLKEDSTTPADPFDMGGGRIDLRQAGNAGLVLDETPVGYDDANPAFGGEPRNLNLPSMADDACDGVCSWTRVLKSTAPGSVTWTAQTSAGLGMALTVTPDTFTLLPGATQVLTVTADVTTASSGTWHFGQVLLVSSVSTVPNAHLPVAARGAAEPPVTGVTLYFHGNLHDAGTGVGEEEQCVGDGNLDSPPSPCNGPLLLKSPELSPELAATWKGDLVEWALSGTSPGGDRTTADPHWVWCLVDQPACHAEDPNPGPVTIQGKMKVEWWASCGPLCLGGAPLWTIRLWADGVLRFEADIDAVGPSLPNVPERLSATVTLPRIEASGRVTLHVEPVFLVDQFLPFLIYYDSSGPCVSGVTPPPCDSLVRMPVVHADLNQPPVAVDDSAFVTNGGSVEVRVLDNDADPEGDPLGVQLVDSPLHGTIQLTAAKTILYDHDGSPTTSDAFTYRITDTAGQSDTATVSVTVAEECLVTTGSFSDDFESGAPGWTLDPAVVTAPSQPWQLTVDPLATSVTHSFFSDSLAQQPDGGVAKDDRLVSPPQFVSPLTHLTFWHRYSFEVGFDGGVLEISTDDGASWGDVLDAGGTFVAGGYDSEIDASNAGNPLQGRMAWTGGSDANGVAGTEMVLVDLDLGALGGNEVRFRWRLGQDELFPSVTVPFGWYVDDVEFTNLYEVDPNCDPNDPPVAENDQASVSRGGSVNIDVRANDADLDDPRESLTVTVESDPSHGTAVAESDGTITYTHNGDAAASDSFQYRLTDPSGAFDVATISVSIPNLPPVASDDAATTRPRAAVTVVVKANDADPDGDPIDVTAVSDPPRGTATLNADDSVTYRPDPGFTSGTDTFEYSLADDRGGSDIGKVTITVSPKKKSGQTAEPPSMTHRADDADQSKRLVDRAPQAVGSAIVALIRNPGTTHEGSSRYDILVAGARIALVDAPSILLVEQRRASFV